MNARIKLLAEQAYDDLVNQTGNIVVFDEDFQQRFAELIVRECALVVHKKTGPKSALNVLEHFGVKE